MKALLIALGSLLATGLIAAEPARAARALRAAPDGAGGGGLSGIEKVLTDEQRAAFREQMKAGGKELRQGLQELVKLRVELQEAVLAGRASATFIQEKAEAIAKLDAQQLQARMTALSKIATTLTDEQRQKLKGMGEQLRAGKIAPGAGLRQGGGPLEPAAPPPPDK